MSGGGSGSTTTTQNGPPLQYLAAYQDVLGKAQAQAATPYQQYQGKLQADFSPMQEQGFATIGSAPGITAPYLNQAAQNFTNATAPLAPSMQPYVDKASGQFGDIANTDLSGAVAPWQQQAQQGFAAGSQALTPQQYSGDAIQSFYNPYQKNVIDAQQQQFNVQNAQAQNQLRGNAASQGALGGDRLGVAQAQLAGQQQMAQAPVIANLQNQGFQQAQQEFNQQQGVNLSAEQNTAARQQQAAQGYAGLGSQSLTAAQQQAALKAQAAQGFAGLGQSELGAAQAQGWLNAQAGSGMAGLGNEALSSTLSSGNALLGAGGQQQAQAQGALNIPYQQFQAQQAYPFQTVGWLSNIAQGLGTASGNVGSSTVPGPSSASQLAGLGTAAVGAAGMYGANNGWFSGGGGAGAGAAGQVAGDAAALAAAEGSYGAAGLGGAGVLAGVKRGGAIRGFAGGGEVPDVSVNGGPLGGLDAPGSETVLIGDGVPDAGTSPIPSGGLAGKGVSGMKRDWGTTTETKAPPHDSLFGTIAKTAGAIAASYFGGPAGGMAANALGSQVHFHRGGFARAPGGSVPVLPRGFAAGGAPAISVASVPNDRGIGVPTMTVDPSVVGPSAGGGSGSTIDQMHDYLAKNKAAATPPPATPAPAPAPAPAAKPDASALTGDQVQRLQAFLAQQAQWQEQASTPSSGGGPDGGGFRKGGMIRGFDDGGDVGGYDDPEQSFTGPDFGTVNNQPAGQRFGDWLHGRDRSQEPPRPSAPYNGLITNQPVGERFKQWLHQDDQSGAAPDQPAGQGLGDWRRAPDQPLGHRLNDWRSERTPDDQPQATPQPGFSDRHPDWNKPILTPDSLRRAGKAIAGFPGYLADDARETDYKFNRQTGFSAASQHPGDLDESDPVNGSIPPPPPPPPQRPNASATADPWARSGDDVPGADRGFNAADFLSSGDARLGRQAVDADAPPAGQTSPGQTSPGSGAPLTGGVARPASYNPPAGSQGTGPLPVTDAPANRESVPSPQSGGSRRPQDGFGHDNERYGDELRDTRALKEDKANPWLALMTAGFGMAAGTSPHALTNIGTGALAGIGQYVTADRAAKELAAKVDENRVRLKETQAYREATAGLQGQKNDIAQQRANTAAAAQQVQANWTAWKQANPKLNNAQLQDGVMKSLEGQINPATQQPWTRDEIWQHMHAYDIRDRAQQAQEAHLNNADVDRSRRTDALIEHYQHSQEYQDKMAELKARGLDDAVIRSAMVAASHEKVASTDPKFDFNAVVAQKLKMLGVPDLQSTRQ